LVEGDYVKALSPGAIGVSAGSLQQSFAAAKIGGFEGVEFSPHEIAGIIEKDSVEAARNLFAEAGIKPAGWGLPVAWNGPEEKWRQGLEELPRLARAAAAIGCPRTMTWIMPGSNERPFEENYRFHVERFTPIAAILADEGCRLGLEFIGPKTLRDAQKYPFVHTMPGMLEMGAHIGPKRRAAARLLALVHLALRARPTCARCGPSRSSTSTSTTRPGASPSTSSSTACAPARRNRRHRHRRVLQSLKAIGYDGPSRRSHSRKSWPICLRTKSA
jgi:hypothetical protein